MPILSRNLFRIPATRLVQPSVARIPRRFAGDYGSVQSGHEQGVKEDNPKKHLEHPGPEPPSTKNPESKSQGDASPKIHQPKSAAEDENEDVRKHNEEMKNRADKSVNQLGEKDNKVDKQFWTGDVGDVKKDS